MRVDWVLAAFTARQLVVGATGLAAVRSGAQCAGGRNGQRRTARRLGGISHADLLGAQCEKL
jgi:hypothetical protein